MCRLFITIGMNKGLCEGMVTRYHNDIIVQNNCVKDIGGSYVRENIGNGGSHMACF